ncbi:MAG TPA: hypothetical protein VGL09_18990 [Methylomirabilota bacterium]|jgi:hypothetical protein
MKSEARATVIIVPRTRTDLFGALTQSLRRDGTTEVIFDRREGDRRRHLGARDPDRRHQDRRLRGEGRDLTSGRWVAVASPSVHIDLEHPDARARLFLCCSEHAIACQTCQDTYRLGWFPRAAEGVYTCPRCQTDLAALVLAHLEDCPFWRGYAAPAAPAVRIAASSAPTPLR